MKRQWIALNIIMLCITATVFSILPACAFEDAIIAVVDDETITLKDLHDYTAAVYTHLKMEEQLSDAQIAEAMNQLKEEGIHRLIDDRLVLSAANKKGVTARRESIDQRINEIKSRYPSEQAFLASLAAEGFTVTELRNRIGDQLKAQFFIEEEVKSAIHINPQDITDYYQNNSDQFLKPEHAEVKSIFIPYGADATASRERANMAFGQLKLGQDFDQVAAQYSEKSLVTTIMRGQMKPEIESQIFNLKEGEFTWPIDSDQGLFIFRLIKKFPAQTVAFDDVKNQIAQFLYATKFQEHMDAWLSKAREDHYIEIKNPSSP